VDSVKIDAHYAHNRTNNTYVVKGFCEYKDAGLGKWLNCVMYSPVDDDSKIYVRVVENFVSRFKKIKDDNGN